MLNIEQLIDCKILDNQVFIWNEWRFFFQKFKTVLRLFLGQKNKYFVQVLAIVMFVVFSKHSFSQVAKIHAVSVGEWKTKELLPPEFHYNSVSVFLLNQEQLGDLFKPDNFTNKERKQMGLRVFDNLESLYFYLQLPNPKQERDTIFFPLYTIDIKRLQSFSVSEEQGCILDKIKDEDLNGQSLYATAKIDAITKNSFLKLAYKLSKSLNQLLEGQLFSTSSIHSVLKSAQHFFEERYEGRIQSEFSIPILPQEETYEYVLQSASLYQVKWDFQSTIRVPHSNVWEEFKDWQKVEAENLKDKPTRLSKLKQYPYLIVLRYKSSFALPSKYQRIVAIESTYLQERRNFLYEFQKGGMKYQLEAQFQEILQEGIDLKRNCEHYLRLREKGEERPDALADIVHQYFRIQMKYREGEAFSQNEAETAAYFQKNYASVYANFLTLLDQECFSNQQLRSAIAIVDASFDMDTISIGKLSTQELYTRIQPLNTYRQIAFETDRTEGAFFQKTAEQLLHLESALFTKVFQSGISDVDKEADIQFLQNQKTRFPHCGYCQKTANATIQKIEEDIARTQKEHLQMLQNQQLKIRACYGSIQQLITRELYARFPKPDSLETYEQSLFDSYLARLEQLEMIATQFSEIENLSISNLDAEKVAIEVVHFEQLQKNYCRQICQLINGELIRRTLIQCLGDCSCGVISP